MVPVIIVLLIIGSVLILASFIFKGSFSDESKGNIMTEAEIERLVERRFSEVKYRLDDEAEKSADIIRDQTERELEKLSNEKIMAVNEYSDQVMDQINKNHNEVMFLYSMLSDKQKELDYAVEKLNQVRRQADDEEKLVQHAKKEKQTESIHEGAAQDNFTETKDKNVQLSFDDLLQPSVKEEVKTSASSKPVDEKYANKSKILQMYNEGYSSMEIAQELRLGIGEVRLVIGLSKERE